MTLLVIDTAAAQCAVALFQDDAQERAMIGVRREAMTRGHAERLFPLIEAVLSDTATRVGDVSAIVVCAGPGGFSGARVGVAAARGLALALGRPAVGVSWLEALALEHAGPALVVAPAGPGLVHAQRFCDGVALGAAATVAQDAAQAAPGEALLMLEAQDDAAMAMLARAGARQLARGDQPRPAPLYLRPPDALPSQARKPRLLV